jgi:intein/homing endonuclease
MGIEVRNLLDITEKNLIEYGWEVVTSRALPDYRDGLKPIHRRILYTMKDKGLKFDGPYSKCARVVGEVMGRFHPHGNIAIYESLINMVNSHVQLIDGMGNFGNVYDKTTAADRYCLVGNSSISTILGNIKMNEIPEIFGHDKSILKQSGKTIPIDLKVLSLNGEYEVATKWINSGKRKTCKLSFENGFELCGTYNEPLYVLDKDFYHKWITIKDIKPGMYVACNRGTKVVTENSITSLEAIFIGYLISDGCIRKSEIQFISAYSSIVDEFRTISRKLNFDFKEYHKKPHSYGVRNSIQFSCGSVKSVKKLRKYGLYPGNSYTQYIPSCIFQSDNEIVAAFLSSYFEGDGSISLELKNHKIKTLRISAHSVSASLLQDIRYLLWSRFGIISNKIRNERKDSTGKVFSITGITNIIKFINNVGFRSKKKINLQKKIIRLVDNISSKAGWSRSDMLPHHKLLPKNIINSIGKTMERFNRDWNKCSFKYKERFEEIANAKYFYTKLIKKEYNGVKWVYDLTVNKTHAFTANNFIVHNTECRLSKYSDKTILDSTYMKIIDFMPNYDGKEQEPIYLPALLPNLLLNGTRGIAVGITSDIPPIKLECLIPFIEKAVYNEEISEKDLAKKIKFNWKYGSNCVSHMDDIVRWIKTGTRSLYFEPNYELDRNGRSIKITDVPPDFNWPNIVKSLNGEDKKGNPKFDFISSSDNFTNDKGILFIIKFKNTIDDDNFDDYCTRVLKEFTNYVKTATNVIHRKSVSEVKPFRSTIPDIIELWTTYRINLEIKVQKFIINSLNTEIDFKDLLLLAIANKDIIRKAWDVDHPEKFLSDKLNINETDSSTILSFTIRSLTKMNKSKIMYDKQELLIKRKQAVSFKNNPEKKILGDINSSISLVDAN